MADEIDPCGSFLRSRRCEVPVPHDGHLHGSVFDDRWIAWDDDEEDAHGPSVIIRREHHAEIVCRCGVRVEVQAADDVAFEMLKQAFLDHVMDVDWPELLEPSDAE